MKLTSLTFTIFLFSLVLSACKKELDPTTPNAPLTPAIKEQLNQLVAPVAGTDPSLSNQDLLFLKPVLSQTQVVGLGEATHGSKEFFQMKHRLFKFLVEEMGYRAIVFEANWGGCEYINRYVHGNGTLDNAAIGQRLQFWTWSTEEVKQLIEWMRAYNKGKTPQERISFLGMDMQSIDNESALLKEYLPKLAPATQQLLADNLIDLPILKDVALYLSKTADFQAAVRQRLQLARQGVEEQKAAITAVVGTEDFLRLAHALDICLQYEDLLTTPQQSQYTKRDMYQAANVKWVREQMLPDQKIAIWAHNGHVQNVNAFNQDYKTLGYNLKQLYGNTYQIFGFSFAKGGFNAVGYQGGQYTSVKAFSLQRSPKPNSVNFLLSQAVYPNLIVTSDKINLLTQPELKDFFFSKRPFRTVGAVFTAESEEIYYESLAIVPAYDHLIHINETSPSVFLQ